MLIKIVMNRSDFSKCIYLRFANLFGNFFEHSCMLFLTLSSPLRRLGILRGLIFCTPTFTDGTKIKEKELFALYHFNAILIFKKETYDNI